MAASMVVGYLAAKVAAGLSRTLRGKVYDKTLDFNMEEINRFSTPSLINRTTNDITQMQTLVAMGLQAIVKAPILAVWAIIKIAGQSWEWTTATAVAVFVLIIMLGATLIFAVPRFRRIQGLTDNLNRITREHLSGIRVVRAYNAEEYQRDKFKTANSELTQTNLVANRVMTHGKSTAEIKSGEKLACIIALGYGETQGVPHKNKALAEVCNCADNMPLWFADGMEAALLAPTATNQQKFYFELNGDDVTLKVKGSGFYTKLDLGIVKCHFEMVSGHTVR